ncbi:lipopolysaccharide biosynthesis protein [Photobacterium leiognathi]|uniref:lipopolysaccharide biosynthesis protein n=1 Tax=Photobacterium leiognathi TaxID=553611 RepID=UPI0029820DDD|nr:oligosaccharide flippase family protein [Photobacterium leiognathi]
MKKDLLIYLFSEAFVKLMPFVLLPYITKMLGVDNFASLSIYRSYASILVVVLGLSAGGAISRYYYKYSFKNINTLIYISNFWIIIFGVFFYIIAIFFGDIFLQMAVISASMQGCLTACLSRYQASKNSRKYMAVQVVNVFISTSITIILFELYESSVLNRIYSLQFAIIIAIIIALPKTKKIRITYLRFFKISKYILSYGFPLTISSIALVLKGNIDRLIIENTISSQLLGSISLAMQLGALLPMVYLIVNRAITPYVFEKFKFNLGSLNYFGFKQISVLVIISLTPFFTCLVIPNDYLLNIFGHGFIDIKYFLLSYLFSYSPQFLVIILTWKFLYFSFNKYILISSFLSTAIHLLLVYIIIDYSVYGVPFVIFVSTLFQVFLLVFFSSKVRKLDSK